MPTRYVIRVDVVEERYERGPVLSTEVVADTLDVASVETTILVDDGPTAEDTPGEALRRNREVRVRDALGDTSEAAFALVRPRLHR